MLYKLILLPLEDKSIVEILALKLRRICLLSSQPSTRFIDEKHNLNDILHIIKGKAFVNFDDALEMAQSFDAG